MTWVVRLRDNGGRQIETATFSTPVAAMAAYRALLARNDLLGQNWAAVFKPPRGVVEAGNNSTFFSRFDRAVGDGRIAPDDPRLEPFTSRFDANEIAMSIPLATTSLEPVDWETDPRPFGICLKAWHAVRGWTRDQAAHELRTPRSTYDGWCAGSPAIGEKSLRRLMALIDERDSRA